MAQTQVAGRRASEENRRILEEGANVAIGTVRREAAGIRDQAESARLTAIARAAITLAHARGMRSGMRARNATEAAAALMAEAARILREEPAAVQRSMSEKAQRDITPRDLGRAASLIDAATPAVAASQHPSLRPAATIPRRTSEQ